MSARRLALIACAVFVLSGCIDASAGQVASPAVQPDSPYLDGELIDGIWMGPPVECPLQREFCAQELENAKTQLDAADQVLTYQIRSEPGITSDKILLQRGAITKYYLFQLPSGRKIVSVTCPGSLCGGEQPQSPGPAKDRPVPTS